MGLGRLASRLAAGLQGDHQLLETVGQEGKWGATHLVSTAATRLLFIAIGDFADHLVTSVLNMHRVMKAVINRSSRGPFKTSIGVSKYLGIGDRFIAWTGAHVKIDTPQAKQPSISNSNNVNSNQQVCKSSSNRHGESQIIIQAFWGGIVMGIEYIVDSHGGAHDGMGGSQ